MFFQKEDSKRDSIETGKQQADSNVSIEDLLLAVTVFPFILTPHQPCLWGPKLAWPIILII